VSHLNPNMKGVNPWAFSFFVNIYVYSPIYKIQNINKLRPNCLVKLESLVHLLGLTNKKGTAHHRNISKQANSKPSMRQGMSLSAVGKTFHYLP
jgi:hypothetical protein